MADPVATTIPLWRSVITWGLIAVGWLIINWQNNYRETRKERRAILDRLRNELSQLESKAIKLHTSAQLDQQLLIEVTRQIKRIWPQIEILGATKINNIKYLTYNLRRAITLHNTDISTFAKQHPGSSLLINISDAIDTLINALELDFTNKYHNPLLQRQWQKRTKRS